MFRSISYQSLVVLIGAQGEVKVHRGGQCQGLLADSQCVRQSVWGRSAWGPLGAFIQCVTPCSPTVGYAGNVGSAGWRLGVEGLRGRVGELKTQLHGDGVCVCVRYIQSVHI